jgi:hypothetical protein
MLDDRLVSHTPLAATILCLGAITPLLPTLRFHTSIAVTVTGATPRRFMLQVKRRERRFIKFIHEPKAAVVNLPDWGEPLLGWLTDIARECPMSE